jgi:peptidoglycan/LPS O-acetylase OafA/YrhL
VSVAYLLPTSVPWLTMLVAIPVAVVVAGLFARLVELPAHRLAKRVARTITARRGRVGGPPARADDARLPDDDRRAA